MRRALLALALLGGCSQQAGQGVETAGTEPVSVTERVASALARGEQAGSGRVDPDSLAKISHFLLAAGARPADAAAPDLATQWAELARAQGVKAPIPFRGRALGPAYRRGRLAAGKRFALEQLFLAGRSAEVALMPVTPARLTLEITDGSPKPICRRGAANPPASCKWLPVYTKRHSVTVSNLGRAAADYYIVIN